MTTISQVNLNQRKMLATKQLQQWYSNGESFLQILPVPKLRKCATSLQSELIITQQGRNVETSVDIHYKVGGQMNQEKECVELLHLVV